MELEPNTLLGIAFTSWAAVVGFSARAFIKRIDIIGHRIEATAEKLNRYIVQTEARIAVLERITNTDNGKGKVP